jgi:hypothetical protein
MNVGLLHSLCIPLVICVRPFGWESTQATTGIEADLVTTPPMKQNTPMTKNPFEQARKESSMEDDD